MTIEIQLLVACSATGDVKYFGNLVHFAWLCNMSWAGEYHDLSCEYLVVHNRWVFSHPISHFSVNVMHSMPYSFCLVVVVVKTIGMNLVIDRVMEIVGSCYAPNWVARIRAIDWGLQENRLNWKWTKTIVVEVVINSAIELILSNLAHEQQQKAERLNLNLKFFYFTF